jgi:hypothetical protein
VNTTTVLARNISACDFQLQSGTNYAGATCVARVAASITVAVKNNQVLLSGTGASRRNFAY